MTVTGFEGDAAALPFADYQFDVVTSCFGVMFALDHRAAASELLRVCQAPAIEPAAINKRHARASSAGAC